MLRCPDLRTDYPGMIDKQEKTAVSLFPATNEEAAEMVSTEQDLKALFRYL